jgi:hypothetical protein
VKEGIRRIRALIDATSPVLAGFRIAAPATA